MAHFAELNIDNVVTKVIVVANATINDLSFPDSEPIGIEFCKSLYGTDTNWKQTSYNANFRKHYAGIGYTYNETFDAFIPPQPYPSWILDNNTADWVAPVPMPTDGKQYTWNETTQLWDVINEN